MIRFLIYLLLIYLALRFLFKLLGGMQGKKVYHQETHHHYHGQRQPNSKSNHTNKDQLGEYVDYEEVK